MNNIKAILYDLDGVLIIGQRFSKIYSQEFNVDINKLLPFLDGKPKEETNLGKADLKELLKNVLKEWEWNGSVEELMSYWINSDTKLNQEMLLLLSRIRKKGIKQYLAAEQDKYRAGFVWEKRGLKNYLDGKYMSYEIGISKNDPQYYEEIVKRLGMTKSEILFVDDSESKIKAAKKSGIQTYQFTNVDDFEKFIKPYLK